MKTQRTLKLNEYGNNEITLTELKEVLLDYYGYYANPLNMSREMVITECKDCHGQPSTIVFSVNGSPPKGIGILLSDNYTDNSEWSGQLILIGNGKISKPIRHVKIKRGN